MVEMMEFKKRSMIKLITFSIILLFLLQSTLVTSTKTQEKQSEIIQIESNKIQELYQSQNINQSFKGYTLFSPEYETNTYLINNDGYIVHKWKSKTIQALGTYFLKDGNLIRTCFPKQINPVFTFGGVTGRIEKLDPKSNVIWEFEYSTKTYCIHHDIEILPNGNILLIAWEIQNRSEAIQNGKDPNEVEDFMLSDFILEINALRSLSLL